MINSFALHKILSLTKNYKTCGAVCLSNSTKGLKYPKKNKTTMQRKWTPDLLEIEKNNSEKAIRQYRLLSYNILAQDLLVEHLHLYYDINHKLLCWENRLDKIKKEITTLQPDILCLQEMQYSHLKELVDLVNSKQNQKFEYVFKKKTGTRSDGCVIIYDRNKFKLISEQYVEYYTEGVSTLNRENIAIMVKFQPMDDSSVTFVVATTHLLYNPKREDVRISQVNKLIKKIINFSSASNNNRLPVILTGDFNFTPNTHAFEMLTALRKPILNSVDCSKTKTVQDFFQLDPVYFGRDGVSTYQSKWIVVDYILKSRSKNDEKSIRVNSTFALPPLEQCLRNGKIPNMFVGSDHFSLAIQFSIL